MLYQELSEGLVALVGALDEVEVSDAQVSAVLAHLAADGEVAKLARAVAKGYSGDCELNVAAAGLLRAIRQPAQQDSNEPELKAAKLVEEPQEDAEDLEDGDDGAQKTAAPTAAPIVSSFYSGQQVTVNGSLYKGPGTVKRISVSEDKVFVRCTNDGKLRSYNSADITAGKLARA